MLLYGYPFIIVLHNPMSFITPFGVTAYENPSSTPCSVLSIQYAGYETPFNVYST